MLDPKEDTPKLNLMEDVFHRNTEQKPDCSRAGGGDQGTAQKGGFSTGSTGDSTAPGSRTPEELGIRLLRSPSGVWNLAGGGCSTSLPIALGSAAPGELVGMSGPARGSHTGSFPGKNKTKQNPAKQTNQPHHPCLNGKEKRKPGRLGTPFPPPTTAYKA